MSPYRIIRGDARETLKRIETASQDALFCDPPYGLEFMGRNWDKALPDIEIWKGVYRTLKPGAYGLVFGGTRTFHRLAVALEDAGFELRDTLMYLYGSGFPKSQDISKAIDKEAGAERAVVGKRTDGRYASGFSDKARQALGGQAASNDNKYFLGEMGVITAPATPEAERWQGYGSALKPSYEPILLVRKPVEKGMTNASSAVRWGAGALNIDKARIGSEAIESGRFGRTECESDAYGKKLYGTEERQFTQGRFPANLLLDESAAQLLDASVGPRKSEGGVSRFFYTSKASRAERDAGLEAFAPKTKRNVHPTVKPLALCRYLAGLLLVPPRSTPRKLLVPFSGTSSEMIGAFQAGWDEVTGLEMDEESAKVGEARLVHWLAKLLTERERVGLFEEGGR